jgi:hypothetical protein
LHPGCATPKISRVSEPPFESDPVIEAYKKDLDLSLLRENLKLTPEQRILKLIELQRFAEELRRAGERARRGR